MPLVQSAFQNWRSLNSFYKTKQQKGEEELLNMCGGIMLGEPGSVVVEGTLASVREHVSVFLHFAFL